MAKRRSGYRSVLANQRHWKEMSQRELADRSGIPLRTIAAIELGEREMDLTLMRTFATALSCQSADLLGPADNLYRLNPDEKRLIDLYRAHWGTTKNMLMAIAEAIPLP